MYKSKTLTVQCQLLRLASVSDTRVTTFATDGIRSLQSAIKHSAVSAWAREPTDPKFLETVE